MKKNIGSAERTARLVFAAALVIPYFMGKLDGTIGIVALVVAAVMVVTAALSYCPLYTIFGGSHANEDPHKSGVCCGHCGSEDAGDAQEDNDGPPILS
ncbi:MAG: DUF2892 domain-containing protein [Marinosulfonomonas sp.]|nr:DUF2892 domain-containing protein [Marinosulfonomonas sp.]